MKAHIFGEKSEPPHYQNHHQNSRLISKYEKAALVYAKKHHRKLYY